MNIIEKYEQETGKAAMVYSHAVDGYEVTDSFLEWLRNTEFPVVPEKKEKIGSDITWPNINMANGSKELTNPAQLIALSIKALAETIEKVNEPIILEPDVVVSND